MQNRSFSLDAIDIWHGKVTGRDDDFRVFWSMLDQTEREYAGKMKSSLMQKRYVEIHGRLRRLLAQLMGRTPDKITIKKSEFGKPYLADYPELVFNLSHSGSSFLIAVAKDCRLGVDMEICKRRADFPALVNKCFAEEEIQYWKQLPETEQIIAFYRFWTRKEAFVKAVGRGLALGLKQCVVNPENPINFLRVPYDDSPDSKWQIYDIDPGPAILGSIVTDKQIDSINIKRLEPG